MMSWDYFKNMINSEPIFISNDNSIIVSENNRTKNYYVSLGAFIPFNKIVVASTTLLPSLIIFLIIVFLTLSKIIFQYSQILLERILRTAMEREKEIEKFSPGTHVGVVIGLIIIILKIIETTI